MSLLVLVITTSMGFCDSVTLVSCPSPTSSHSGNKTTFTFTNCQATVDNTSGTSRLGVYTTTNNSTFASGRYNQAITLSDTTGEYRFYSSGTPVDVPVSVDGTSFAEVVTNIGLVTGQTYYFNLYYEVFDRDIGDNVYYHTFYVGLYHNGQTTQQAVSGQISLPNMTVPNIAYINVSAAPTITYASSSEVFNPAGFKESANITATVKSNQTWKLQFKMSRAPKDDGTLDQIAITNTYIKASGAGFDNLASSYTQFTAADTYVDIADNTDSEYTTGGDANGNLIGKDVTLTFKVNNTASAYNKGTYTSPGTFNVNYAF